jgi:hypothetical protein
MDHILLCTSKLPVTVSSNPIKQPKIVAKSPTTVAMTPIKVNDVINLSQPENIAAGGIKANKTFQKNEKK